jgi:hypothetical protein
MDIENFVNKNVNYFVLIVIAVMVIGHFTKPSKKEGFGNYVRHQPLRTVKWKQDGEAKVEGHQNCNYASVIDFRIPADIGALRSLMLEITTNIPTNVVGVVNASIKLDDATIATIGPGDATRIFDLTYLLKTLYGTEHLRVGDYHRIVVNSCSHYVPVTVSNSCLTMTYNKTPEGIKLGWYNGPN